MDKEDYVSLEVAKLLKEKGFNEPCRVTYFEDDNNVHISAVFTRYNENLDDNSYSCPTLYEAHKWLRNKHNTYVEVDSGYNKNGKLFSFTINHYNNNDDWDWGWETEADDYYKEYEGALNRGIKEALKLI